MDLYGGFQALERISLIRVVPNRHDPAFRIVIRPYRIDEYMPLVKPVQVCDNCEKKTYNAKCAVLHDMVGMNKPCFAWSDDPDWEKKVKQAVKDYENMAG